MHVPRDSPNMTALKFFKKGCGHCHETLVNFLALNANSFKMVKATDFIFGRHVPRDDPNMTVKNV